MKVEFSNIDANVKYVPQLDTDLINLSPFNPPDRTEPEALKKMRKLVEETGKILDTIAVVDWGDGTYVIADGHRRYTVAQELGIKALRADVYAATDGNRLELVKELFRQRNLETKSFKNREACVSALLGNTPLNAGVKSAVGTLQELFPTQQERDFLVASGVGSYLLNVAKRVTVYCLQGSGIGKDTPTFRARLRKTVLWLIAQSSQQSATAYMRCTLSPKRLKAAIDAGKPTPGTTV